VASFIAPPDEVLSQPGVLNRVIALGIAAPQYPLPGPARPARRDRLNRRKASSRSLARSVQGRLAEGGEQRQAGHQPGDLITD
jgi:hypothetical protein